MKLNTFCEERPDGIQIRVSGEGVATEAFVYKSILSSPDELAECVREVVAQLNVLYFKQAGEKKNA